MKHAQLSFVEIAVRNAVDPVLADWNATQPGYARDWTAQNGAANPVYGLMKRSLPDARRFALQESQRRPKGHPRRDAPVTHDDIVAQLMFGAWVKLIHDTGGGHRQRDLWRDALHEAFPFTGSSDDDRLRLGAQLESMRRLRNRVAHHDNLLGVNVRARMNESLSLLAKINPDFPTLAAAQSPLRRRHEKTLGASGRAVSAPAPRRSPPRGTSR
jgi:hypothetical protein